MIRSKSTEQSGWALPITLFALAIMLSTMHVLSLESIDALQIATEPRRSERLHATIAGSLRDARAAGQRCESIVVTHNGAALSYEVCRESVVPFMTQPTSVTLPLHSIDYDPIFAQASECPSATSATIFRDMDSPFAPRDCLLPSALNTPFVILDNIAGEATSITTRSASNATLATPGRVHISQELIVSSDLLILAGGDVTIAAIRALPSTSAKVTILSSLGSIRIGLVEGAVSLLVAGRKELAAPDTPLTSDYPLPPFRAVSIYGFRPIN
jgi:hypothetical protein